MDWRNALQDRERLEDFQRQHRVKLITCLLAETVMSVECLEGLGLEEHEALLERHQAVVGEVLEEFPDAEAIAIASDWFSVIFAQPADSVRFALLLDGRLR